jgi:hypothetical protein
MRSVWVGNPLSVHACFGMILGCMVILFLAVSFPQVAPATALRAGAGEGARPPAPAARVRIPIFPDKNGISRF